MSGFELPIFPSAALDSSVLTTVWVGVCVVALLNLRYGLTIAGLVVPGYLVPLLIVKPASALVTVGEALVTYALARFAAEWLLKRFGAAEMFGRDRFFAVLLFSVLVRVLGDGWVLPAVSDWLATSGVAFDYRHSLNSFGLVIVALIANQLWNGGPARGLLAFGIYTGLTFLIVRFVLMPFTNFTIGDFSYMYEDVASNILASPKAYIILLTTAFIASRLNVNFGWEFGGIVIPALLALQWYQPTKLLATFGEAFVILFFGRLALRLPIFSRMNMEGSRLLLLFFNVGFIYKAIVGLMLAKLAPQLKVSDFYAFGYLLSTLMAIKMHQKQLLLQLTRTSLQTSLVAVAVASLIGYTFVKATENLTVVAPTSQPADMADAPSLPIARDVATAIVSLKPDLYRSDDTGNRTPAPREVERFRSALQWFARGLRDRDTEAIERAKNEFATVQYDLAVLRSGHWLLRDLQPQRGFGVYLVDPAATRPLLLEVPAPLDEPAVLEAAAQLYEREGYSALAIGGARRARSRAQSSDVLRAPSSFFQEFHRAFEGSGVLQLRRSEDEVGAARTTTLWVKRELPPALSVLNLQRLIGPIEIAWSASPATVNRLRDVSATKFVELYLDGAQLRSLIAERATADGAALSQESIAREPIQAAIGRLNAQILARGSESYRPPELSDLLFLDQEVIRPLLQIAAETGPSDPLARAKELLALAGVARARGYRVWEQHDPVSGERYLLLAEEPTNSEGERHGWGSLILRLGGNSDLIVEVPRPFAERYTVEYGAALFRRVGARALLLAGAHPAANRDESADLVRIDNRRSLLQLAHERLLRSARVAPLVLQVRAAPQIQRMPAVDVVVAFEEGGPEAAQSQQIAKLLASDGSTVELTDGSARLREFKTSRNAQALATRSEPRAQFATLWVALPVREAFRFESRDSIDAQALALLNIDTRAQTLQEWRNACRGTAPQGAAACRQTEALVERFITVRDIAALQVLQSAQPTVDLTRVLDRVSGQAFLAACLPGAGAQFIASLNRGRRGVLTDQALSPGNLTDLQTNRGALASSARSCAGP
jgi:hypothetical protein